MAKSDYERTIKLKHTEAPAKINKISGEVTELKDHFNENRYTDPTVEKFDLFKVFQRTNTAAWEELARHVKPSELGIAMKLAIKAEAYTNSLKPLHEDSSILFISQHLKIDRRIVAKVMDKLFKLGVIGKFEVCDEDQNQIRYWVFNPYLSFNGKHIKKDVRTLFDNTRFARVMRNSNYES